MSISYGLTRFNLHQPEDPDMAGWHITTPAAAWNNILLASFSKLDYLCNQANEKKKKKKGLNICHLSFYQNLFSGIAYSIMSNKTLPYLTILVFIRDVFYPLNYLGSITMVCMTDMLDFI